MEIRGLTEEERETLENARKGAAQILGAEPPLSIEHVQELYDRSLAYAHNERFLELEFVTGVAFGDLVAAKTGWEWVIRVDDVFGTVWSLSPPGSTATIHPIDMVQKRIDEGEEAGLARLRDAIADVLLEKLRKDDQNNP